ncbi:hypothetical protein TH63_02120 [Rufibacter radiotolerans]|uniref:DUF6799 domain-containing protein n=1 Tax=Rufibacter radiotolerans TaxID=1379910 RepID=A0A0H4VLB1_9BACT|nr:hypothetical protein TH63_02120 [Rufibacter radiotolerans]
MLAQAQKATIQKRESGRTTTPSVTPMRQGVIIRNGVPVEVQGNKFTPIANARTFKNGTVLQTNGQLTLPGGEVVQLKEGDRIDMKGNLTRSPVVVERTTTVTGDTAGIGKQLMQAQQQHERQKLLQEKMRLLEEKNRLLEKTIKSKPDAARLQKLDADLAKAQQQIDAENKKGQ